MSKKWKEIGKLAAIVFGMTILWEIGEHLIFGGAIDGNHIINATGWTVFGAHMLSIHPDKDIFK